MKMCNSTLLKFFLLLICYALCSYRNNDTKFSEHEHVKMDQPEVIGKKIILPDMMEMYSPFKTVLPDSKNEMVNGKLFKIYAYMNVSCPTCIIDIIDWQEFISKAYSNTVKLIMVCSSKDRFEYFKYLCETKQINPFHFPLYLDTANQYSKYNPFVNGNPVYQTLLTNADNMILVAGNPIHSDTIRKLYLYEINKKETDRIGNL